MFRFFKLPLIVTAVVFLLVVLAGIASFFWIGSLPIPDREKAQRATMLGTGLGTMACFIIAPFWFYGAAQAGKVRRAALAQKKKQR